MQPHAQAYRQCRCFPTGFLALARSVVPRSPCLMGKIIPRDWIVLRSKGAQLFLRRAIPFRFMEAWNEIRVLSDDCSRPEKGPTECARRNKDSYAVDGSTREDRQELVVRGKGSKRQTTCRACS